MGILFSICSRKVFKRPEILVTDGLSDSSISIDSTRLPNRPAKISADKPFEKSDLKSAKSSPIETQHEDRAPGPRFPAELLIQVLSEVGVTNDGFLWLNCRPVSRAFKDWVEDIYYNDYIPHLQLHTLVRVAAFPAEPDDPVLQSGYHTSIHSFPDPVPTTTNVVTAKVYKRLYKASKIRHLDPSKVIFELIEPRCVQTITETNGTVTSMLTSQDIEFNDYNGNFTSSDSVSVEDLSISNSFHHFMRAASSLCGPRSDQFVGCYAVRWCKPIRPDDPNDEQTYYTRHLNKWSLRNRGIVSESMEMNDGDDGRRRRRGRIHEYHRHDASEHWSYSTLTQPAVSPAATNSSSSAWSLPSFLAAAMRKGKGKAGSRSLPIVRSEFAGGVAEGEFLEVDWRMLVGQSCCVRETHWLVDWDTGLRHARNNDEHDGGGDADVAEASGSGQTGVESAEESEPWERRRNRVRAKRLRMVFWCADGGLVGEE
ncbi:hypothetical protein DM02DRAFT_146945 [Periconia macrospinosa]|uniref:Uncharacterized protein n=1 Tax=Periconia macrospinosa TaxID=97972 RepID=A0A2V1DDC7_9PLEO|nr:hypothetical protein DM02DRAFT_146945 [Periconia macrospinosa]